MLILLTIAACAVEHPDAVYADPASTTPTAIDTGKPPAPELPDLLAQVSTDHCEDVANREDSPGATSYVTGEFILDEGNRWVGTERWGLFATKEWEALGGADCVVTWDVVGYADTDNTCDGCAFVLHVTGELNGAATTCPAQMYSGEETYSVDYDVFMDLDAQTSSFRFSTSQSTVGGGVALDGAVSYITPATCLWF